MAQKKEIDKVGAWFKKHKYHPYVTSSVQRNLRAWMDRKTPEEVISLNTDEGNKTKFKKLVDEAVEDQTEIGWQHFTCGQISTKWHKALIIHHEERKKREPGAKLTPPSTMVRMLWEIRLSLWNHRNGMKHGKTPEEREENLRNRLGPQIRRAYADQYSRMTPTARRTFSE